MSITQSIEYDVVLSQVSSKTHSIRNDSACSSQNWAMGYSKGLKLAAEGPKSLDNEADVSHSSSLIVSVKRKHLKIVSVKRNHLKRKQLSVCLMTLMCQNILK